MVDCTRYKNSWRSPRCVRTCLQIQAQIIKTAVHALQCLESYTSKMALVYWHGTTFSCIILGKHVSCMRWLIRRDRRRSSNTASHVALDVTRSLAMVFSSNSLRSLKLLRAPPHGNIHTESAWPTISDISRIFALSITSANSPLWFTWM